MILGSGANGDALEQGVIGGRRASKVGLFRFFTFACDQVLGLLTMTPLVTPAELDQAIEKSATLAVPGHV